MSQLLYALIPLLILVALAVFIGVVIYVSLDVAKAVKDNTKERMQTKHHLTLRRDGVTVSVNNLQNEIYVDKTQSYLVQAWNFSKAPITKHRWWNKGSREKEA